MIATGLLTMVMEEAAAGLRVDWMFGVMLKARTSKVVSVPYGRLVRIQMGDGKDSTVDGHFGRDIEITLWQHKSN
jgi:hypothetical protein